MEQPALNACFNGISACLLAGGFLAIRRKQVKLHRGFMVGALMSSALFLASYVHYHATSGHTTCVAEGWIRTIYLLLLGPHVLLAALMVPLILVTVTQALRGRFESHRRVARVTLPIWLYVSVTGVLIYLYIYRFFPGPEYFLPPGG